MNKDKIIHAADLFCGAGGTTTGLRKTVKKLGYKLSMLALNHWKTAVASHTANYPDVKHICESIDSVDPRKAIPGGHLDILMASPECVHFSNARGGKPCSDQSRATAWHILRWCDALTIDNVLIENVREFKNWGPLGTNDRPLKSRLGETYQAFLAALRSLNYTVEEKILNAADFGGATTRSRLFILARRGNKKVNWPDRTHAPAEDIDLFGKHLKPWRAAREIINWDLHGKSIFGRKKPLSPNTMRRIAAGMKKFCGVDLEPFFVMYYGTGKSRSVKLPLPTVTAVAQHIALCEPFIIPQQSGPAPRSVGKPIPAICTAGKIRLVEPLIMSIDHTGSNGLCTRSAEEPLGTITTKQRFALLQPQILPFIVEVNHTDDKNGNPAVRTHSIDNPLPGITTHNGKAMIEPFLVDYHGQSTVHSVKKPLPAQTTKTHHALAQPFLTEYYGNGKPHSVDKSLHTVTTHDRFALVEPIPVVNGGKKLYLDIRLRMLTPQELSLAMGFPANYIFTGNQAEQVKQIGNGVQVDLAEKLTYAVLYHLKK
ncbi:MAG: DNA cytosine methyltransferase [Caldisericia bacterium]